MLRPDHLLAPYNTQRSEIESQLLMAKAAGKRRQMLIQRPLSVLMHAELALIIVVLTGLILAQVCMHAPCCCLPGLPDVVRTVIVSSRVHAEVTPPILVLLLSVAYLQLLAVPATRPRSALFVLFTMVVLEVTSIARELGPRVLLPLAFATAHDGRCAAAGPAVCGFACFQLGLYTASVAVHLLNIVFSAHEARARTSASELIAASRTVFAVGSLTAALTGGMNHAVEAMWMRAYDTPIGLVDLRRVVLAFSPAAVHLVLGLLPLASRPRALVQARIAKLGAEVSSAAAISALFVGSRTRSASLLNSAESTFRGVAASEIASHKLGNHASLEARAQGRHTHGHAQPPLRLLGEIDAFVSHSWHDDINAKWEALQEWIHHFRAKRGRDPVLWIDACCIDRSDIGTSITCLPVYIAGCQRLVVLRGPSLHTRLWCVVELFVYIAMGGSPERMDVISFGNAPALCTGGGGAQAGSWSPRVASKATTVAPEPPAAARVGDKGAHVFDARNCKCAFASDQQLLLGVIDAYAGGTDGFNAALLAALRQGEEQWARTRGLSTASSRGTMVAPKPDVQPRQDAQAAPDALRAGADARCSAIGIGV